MLTLILGQYKPVYDSWCQFQTFTQILFKLENWVYRYGGNTWQTQYTTEKFGEISNDM